MSAETLTVSLSSADHTAKCAARLAPLLRAGDVILLHGDVGAGKTHFARALIQTRLTQTEDVPSPTFTLVQTYAADTVEIWHADLYRLSSVQEVEELGLTDAFETAICLVEWPDRLGALAPATALNLTFATTADEDARLLTACWSDPRRTKIFEAWQK